MRDLSRPRLDPPHLFQSILNGVRSGINLPLMGWLRSVPHASWRTSRPSLQAFVEHDAGRRSRQQPRQLRLAVAESCLISCTQPGPVGGLAARVGMQGSMKPSVRTRRGSIRVK
jgi:hypothetical protein